jgi:predicted permease
MHPGQIFMTALNAVAPIILLILLGYLLRQKGFLTEGFLKNGNSLVFKILLPTMLFINIYHIESLVGIRWEIAIYALTAICVIFCLSLATAILTTPVAERRGVILQCCFRSNFVIIGLPLAASLGGSEAEAVAAVLSAVSIPLFNVLAVISLSVFVGRKESFWQSVKQILKSIVTNPLIIAVALGMVCVSLRWVQTAIWGGVLFRLDTQAVFFFDALITLKNGTTALALMVLGGQFVFSAVKELKKEILVATLWRVVLSPVIGVGGAILLTALGVLHCTAADYPALIALYGSPVAVSSAIMAKGMDGDEQLATQLVVWTTLFSSITVFLTVCILMATGLIPA